MPESMDVVVITAHDLGRHLHCYGVESVASPNLDRLAAEGILFRSAFATAPQCSPSRASIATGLYPHRNGVMGLAHHGFDWELAPGVTHAAAHFARLGFETHLFGLQHVTLHLERLGFGHIYGADAEHVHARGHIVADAVERFLAGNRDAGALYLEINVEETHRPYDRVPPADASKDVTLPPYLPRIEETKAELRALEASVKALDLTVGRIIEAVARAGRLDRTLLLFTTDHGLAMPRAKCTLYDPGLEVTLMVRWPASGMARGLVKSELISNIDILPTLLEAVGADPPPGLDGRSFLPLLREGSYQPRSAIFAEKTYHSYYDPMRCVRTDHFKYILNFETGFAVDVPADVQQGAIFRADPSRYSTDRAAVAELYDLQADPGEQRNLAGSGDLETVERELNASLWEWLRETNDPLLSGPIASPRNRLAMERKPSRH
jgi:arylsulfatase A-like enzyme